MLPYVLAFSLKNFQIALEHLKERNTSEFLVRDIFYVNSQWCTTVPTPTLVPD